MLPLGNSGAPLRRDVSLKAPAAEHRLFVNARQRDQSRVWTSALFLSGD